MSEQNETFLCSCDGKRWAPTEGFATPQEAAESYAELMYTGEPLNANSGTNVYVRTPANRTETRYLVRAKLTIEWGAVHRETKEY